MPKAKEKGKGWPIEVCPNCGNDLKETKEGTLECGECGFTRELE